MNEIRTEEIVALETRLRQEILEDLVGLPEIADELGVPIDRIRQWITRRESVNCPEPVKPLRGMKLYSMIEWRGWYTLWKATRGSETWWTSNR